MHLRLQWRYWRRRARHRLAQQRRQGAPRYLPAALNPGAPARALLVHLVEPFSDRGFDVRHQNRWQARELGRLLAAQGFRVDVAEPGCATIPADAVYELVVDLHPGLTRYPIGPATRRIAYITGSNPAFSNAAERRRLADVSRRRHAVLRPRRQVPEFSADNLGRCAALWFIGSAANLETYRDLPLPPVSFVRNFAYPVARPAHRRADPRHFLFLASGGQVHKGLDLLLEVFAAHPEWTLHVCSNFHEEPDFVRAYRRELFGCANILAHGFQRLDSPEFAAIAGRCTFVVLPSCSEANAGSVLSGMAAGLIPLVSRETGFADDEVAYFADCSVAAIAATLAHHGARPADELEHEAERMRDLVAERYSPARFTESLEAAFRQLSLHRSPHHTA